MIFYEFILKGRRHLITLHRSIPWLCNILEEKMASAQLKIIDLKTGAVAGDVGKSTSVLKSSVTYDLSEKTKVTAHPGDKWKAGYMTFARMSQVKSGWRNVHLSKTSFEKLGKELTAFQDTLKSKGEHKVMLTKKQHVITTRFTREGKDTLYYVSIMHPTQEKEDLTPKDAVNHAKTINLSSDEFDMFVSVYEKLAEVVKSRASTGENDEAAMIDGFRWICKHTGTRSTKIFLSLQDCTADAYSHHFNANKEVLQAQPMESDDLEANFDFFTMTVDRPSKLEVIEHLAYATVLRNIMDMNVETDSAPPSEETVNDVLERFDRAAFAALVKKVLMKLVYKNLYLTGELISIFMYFEGMEKVKTNLVKHTASCSGKLFTRLVDSCFDIVYDEMNNKD